MFQNFKFANKTHQQSRTKNLILNKIYTYFLVQSSEKKQQ